MPFVQFQLRRGLAAEWASVNPILAQGEMGLEIDTKQIKVGDGVNAWNALQYGIGYNDLYAVTSTGNTTNVAINITNTAVSSNSVTGALTVSGGVGIGGNLNVNGSISSNGIVSNSSTVTVNTAPVVVDQYSAAQSHTTKYLIEARRNNDQHSMEVLLINDSNTAYHTAYASLVIGNQLITVDSAVVSSNVQLTITGINNGNNVKIFSSRV